jgi:hypothetical protein
LPQQIGLQRNQLHHGALAWLLAKGVRWYMHYNIFAPWPNRQDGQRDV